MSERDLEPLGADLARLFESERDRPVAAPGAQDRVLARLHATLALGPSMGGGESAGPNGGEIGGAGGEIASPGAGGHGAIAGGSALAGGSAALAGGSAAPAIATGIGGTASTGLLGSLIPAILAKPVVFGVAVFALGGAIGAGVYSGIDASPPPQAVVISAPSPAAAPPLLSPAKGAGTSSVAWAPAVTTIPSGDPAASPPAASARVAPQDTAEPVGRDVDLAAERAVLEEARTAVAGGQSAAAFAALQRHARTFPRGRLVEEREGLWIQTLIASGRQAEARDRLARFRKSFPRSMLLPGFDASLDPNP